MGKFTSQSYKHGGRYVPDSSRDLTERLFAWSSRVDVAAGLWWGDLLNTAPPTTVLLKEGLIGFAEKPKTRGSLWVGHAGRVITHFLTKNGCIQGMNCSKTSLWILAEIFGYATSNNNRVCIRFSNPTNAFLSCASKMMTCLLFQSGRPDGHAIRPHSLKVATISVSMAEVAKMEIKLRPASDSRKLQCGHGPGYGYGLFA